LPTTIPIPCSVDAGEQYVRLNVGGRIGSAATFARLLATHGVVRIALASPDDLPFAVARAFATLASRNGPAIQAFRSLNGATSGLREPAVWRDRRRSRPPEPSS